MQSRSDKRIAIIVSSPVTVSVFLAHQIQALAQRYVVTVVANFGAQEVLENLPNNVTINSIPICDNSPCG